MRTADHIPIFFRWLFQIVLPDRDYKNLLGDYQEIYALIALDKSRRAANFWIFSQWIKSYPLYGWEHIRGSLIMFNNIVRTAIRRLSKQKGYSFLNIAGLALGLACTLLILLWVKDELSYDRFHEHAHRLYRIEMDDPYPQGDYHLNVTPYPMGPAVRDEIPEIENQLRLAWTGSVLFQHGDQYFFEQRGRGTDPSFFQTLSFPLQAGDPATALASPDAIVLTSELAKKYFGEANPLGQTLILNNTSTMRVTGVLAPLPSNTSFAMDYLVPINFMRTLGRYNDSWTGNAINTLVMLTPRADASTVARKIADMRHQNARARFTDAESRSDFDSRPAYRCSLKPVTDIHLRSFFGFKATQGDIQYVYLFAAIAFIVLLIACINFMNLSTAKAAGRAKEIGLRKTVGAGRRSLVAQFYGETAVLTVISLLLALIFIALLLPTFNQMAQKSLSLTALFSLKSLLGLTGVCLLTALLAGSYPALYLSSMQAGQVLKGRLSKAASNIKLRRILVIGQFALSIVLIVSSVVVYRQLQYAQQRDVGYEKANLIFMEMRGDMRGKYNLLKNRLQATPGVQSVCAASNRPSIYYSNGGGAEWEGMDPSEDIQVTFNIVDFDFCKTLGVTMASGRPFNVAMASDSSSFLINETLAQRMGHEDVLGKRFNFLGIDGHIVGVIKDFHFKSAKEAIEPLAVAMDARWANFIYIRLAPGNHDTQIDALRQVWTEALPGYPFDYQFVEDDYQWIYGSEHRLGGLIRAFTILAVIIAALGLFGLASFTAEQRTKEIGVRKVLGATIPGIIRILSMEFARWILWANLLALPTAWFILGRWLEGYADRVALSWWIFALSGGGALLLALATVSAQAIKAATANPVQSLKNE